MIQIQNKPQGDMFETYNNYFQNMSNEMEMVKELILVIKKGYNYDSNKVFEIHHYSHIDKIQDSETNKIENKHNFCKDNSDGLTQSLILQGGKVEEKLGRRLKDWDFPRLILFLAKNKNVTNLCLANNEITSTGLMNLIDHLTLIDSNHIIELDLRNNDISNLPPFNYLVHKASRLLNLQIFRLSGNNVGIDNSKRIAQMLSQNRSIRRLDLAQIGQDESSLVAFFLMLSNNRKNPNTTIKILDLSRPVPQSSIWVLDTSFIAVELGLMLRYNQTLEELRLQNFNFYCHDIGEMLENASYNKTLKLLDLNCNNIGDFGLEVLSKWLKKGSALESLSLSCNIITDHGLRALHHNIPYSKLRELDLSYNCIGDETAVELVKYLSLSSILRKVRIAGNKLGPQFNKVLQYMYSEKLLTTDNIDVIPRYFDDDF
ncbi:hypothetical protein TKK_0015831 [Trichogramma kaykai]|uniref:Uncharacterized protein n=1 Tax=Trichogramma kaykai TaxID=54128 RepID=A0ABD2W841_9HYME